MTPTPKAFAIQDKKFEGYQQECGTDVNITAIDGDSFAVSGGTLAYINGSWVVFCWGARHTWIGTLTYAGYTFSSDEKDPLQFMFDRDRGYVYVGGTGSVTLPDKTIVMFP